MIRKRPIWAPFVILIALPIVLSIMFVFGVFQEHEKLFLISISVCVFLIALWLILELSVRTVAEVDGRSLRVKAPFFYREIPLSDVESVECVTGDYKKNIGGRIGGLYVPRRVATGSFVSKAYGTYSIAVRFEIDRVIVVKPRNGRTMVFNVYDNATTDHVYEQIRTSVPSGH